MAQLVVRKLEETVVAKLRRRAARQGVSVEEEHRRILRAAVEPTSVARGSLKNHLLAMPDVGDDRDFGRPAARPRKVRLS